MHLDMRGGLHRALLEGSRRRCQHNVQVHTYPRNRHAVGHADLGAWYDQVLHYANVVQAFNPGEWMPAGLTIETKRYHRCAVGAGKRTAEAILHHFLPEYKRPQPGKVTYL